MNNWHTSCSKWYLSHICVQTNDTNNYILHAKHFDHCYYCRSKWLLQFERLFCKRRMKLTQQENMLLKLYTKHHHHLLMKWIWINSLKHRHSSLKDFVLKLALVNSDDLNLFEENNHSKWFWNVVETQTYTLNVILGKQWRSLEEKKNRKAKKEFIEMQWRLVLLRIML